MAKESFSVTSGTITIAGLNATVVDTLPVSPGQIAINSFNANVNDEVLVDASTGAVIVAGVNPNLSADVEVSASTGTIAVTGLNSFVFTGYIDCILGLIVIAGYDTIIVGFPSVTDLPANRTFDIDEYSTTLTIGSEDRTVSI